MSIDSSIRQQLAELARYKSTRTTAFSPDRPTDWRPEQVPNPQGILDRYFTDASAWDLVVSKLEEGHLVEEIELEVPPGKKGYVMIIELPDADRSLYVKLQLGSGKVIGRSFHYSEYRQPKRLQSQSEKEEQVDGKSF